MKTFTIIYLSGVVFFLAQAAIYATPRTPSAALARIWGAWIWPIGMLHLPSLIMDVGAARRAGYDYGRLSGIAWGLSPSGDRLWGIGA